MWTITDRISDSPIGNQSKSQTQTNSVGNAYLAEIKFNVIVGLPATTTNNARPRPFKFSCDIQSFSDCRCGVEQYRGSDNKGQDYLIGGSDVGTVSCSN